MIQKVTLHTIFLFGVVLLFLVNFSQCNKRVKRIVGGEPADLPPRDDPLVYLRFAGRAAAIRGVQGFPHYVFRGIRYGLKPTGKDRFQRPRQYFLQGEYNATLYPPPCVQEIPGERKVVGSEDCLFLNVFTPELPDGTEGLPVIVWIHGGGFRYGSASQYGVRNLVGRRLVLVTLQYRLGTLGFLSTGTQELPGNAALWDMALGVQWVRNHIGFFGGNPHRIVVMGQGTGASSALMIALSNIAKGSVSAVVAMSGTAVSHWAIDNTPAVTAKNIADYHSCPSNTALTMLKCLQNVPAEAIVQGDTSIEETRISNRGFVSGLNGQIGPSPNQEWPSMGRSLPSAIEREPLDDMVSGNIPEIPLLTGITKDETAKAVSGQYKDEIIKKLKTIPNFMDRVLVQNLQSFTGLIKPYTQNKNDVGWNHLDPLQFHTYFKVSKNNLKEGIQKIAEATGDALFNLPAFITADFWSKKGSPTFLYSFEHVGKAAKAHNFLRGFPLVGNGTETDDMANDLVGHGDDLAYVFDPQTLDGTPIPATVAETAEDARMRTIYTDMIAEFARTGKLTTGSMASSAPSFTESKNNYIRLSTQPHVADNFRYCEMALWAGLAQRLQSASCQFLKILDGGTKWAENAFFDTVSVGNGSVNKINEGVSGAEKTISGVVNKLNPFSSNRGGRKKNNMIPPVGFL